MAKKLMYSDDYIALGLLILRIGIGIAFVVHGIPKVFGGAEHLAGALAKAGIPGGILGAYMAGLALGSYIFGRIIDRRGNPIFIYGLLELGIGIFALIFPLLVAGLTPLYRTIYPGLQGSFYSLSLIRFALSFLILLVPTTLMGGTLPILSR